MKQSIRFFTQSLSGRFIRFTLKLFALLIVAGMTLAAASSQAAQLYISSTGSDSHPCTQSLPCLTLQRAVNVASNGDTIHIAAGTYAQSLTTISSKNLNILGAGASDTILLGQSGVGLPVIDIVGNSVVTISSVTVTEGGASAIVLEVGSLTLENCVVSNSFGFRANPGGGITNGGILTLRGATIRNNQSPDGGGGGIENSGGVTTIIQSTISGNSSPFVGGGGIHNLGGLVTLIQSTISGNSGINGGGILTSFGTLQILNSTISGNTASHNGGGIEADTNSNVELNNATIANNFANVGSSGGTGGGLNMSLIEGTNVPSSLVALRNTILTPNFSHLSIFPFIALNDCGAARLVSGGYNLLGFIGRCSLASPGTDRTNVNVLLGPLQNNGGPTETMLPQSSSPAIDAGNPAGCSDPFGNKLTVDQRGLPRPDADDVRCDIGAVEVQQ